MDTGKQNFEPFKCCEYVLIYKFLTFVLGAQKSIWMKYSVDHDQLAS